MKHLLKLMIVFIGCQLLNAQTINDLSFGTNDTFEVMTWNLQTFPKNGQQTIDDVAQVIEALDVDMVAIQEIGDQNAFNQLANSLPNYTGYMESTYYDGLGILYKSSVININSVYRIYETSQYWNAFPRAPMIVDMTYNNQEIFVIDNHLKCCGDGTLLLNNTSDEEYRRYEAVNLLKTYIDNNLQNDNVIVLGDMNDELTDAYGNNVFQNILDDSSNYLFTDYAIASGSSSNWSYPSWPSHLDHILITNELFDEFNLPSANIQTIKVDNYLPGGWSEYYTNITDHRPVALKLTIDSSLGTKDVGLQANNFINYPNPFNFETTFNFAHLHKDSKLDIVNMLGQTVFSKHMNEGATSFTWQPNVSLPNGLYFAILKENDQVVATRKLILKN